MDDLFIHLGTSNNVFFFQHVIQPGWDNGMSHPLGCQIYNCLINYGYVIDPSVYCVIYEIDPINKTWDVNIISHKDAKNKIVFPKEILESMLKRLYLADRSNDEEILIFTYNKQAGAFFEARAPNGRLQSVFSAARDAETIEIREIHEYMTIKPIG